ncbi:toll/interleukin-1 receptor domain-containing protein [Mucilaginibacter angelicae]|uniref:Toll/interleukin-1 receptor domain-containing protein n=1 Tax=Mucilaginibacter angelicae TaxID=869718 RepID=A0ABV6LHM3_9SPHI
MRLQQKQPVVFISYSYAGDGQEWVSVLAKKIKAYPMRELPPVSVIFDQDNGHLGNNLYTRMQASIAAADVILLILTPDYKEKADQCIASVGYEYNLVRRELFKRGGIRKKCIPVLKDGTLTESMPTDLYHLIGIDMSTREKFQGGLTSLIQSIVNPALINDPEKTVRPDYSATNSKPVINEQTQLIGTTVLFSMIAGTALIAAIKALDHYQHPLPGHHHQQGTTGTEQPGLHGNHQTDAYDHFRAIHHTDPADGHDLSAHHHNDHLFHQPYPEHTDGHHHDLPENESPAGEDA